jgi:hypothetical protein
MIRAEIVVLPNEIKGFSARICLLRDDYKWQQKGCFFVAKAE